MEPGGKTFHIITKRNSLRLIGEFALVVTSVGAVKARIFLCIRPTL